MGLDFWKGHWLKTSTPPWDTGKVSAALQAVVENRRGEAGTPLVFATALVPGCGMGYDVCYLAQRASLYAIGLDLSPVARELATAAFAEAGVSSQARYEVGDFFAPSTLALGPVDLVYDHTFFCAILPALRPAWARQMAALVAPGGHLITYIFPINTHEGGPPFAVQPEHYQALLERDFALVYMRDIQEEEKFDRRRASPHKEKIALWRRK
jgi:methyl halide transferase